MTDLHWTGAALLLAIALGPSVSRARRATVVTWSEFAREHGLTAEEPAREAPASSGPPLSALTARPGGAPDPYQPRAATDSRATRLRAAAVCGHCGHEAGELEWDAAETTKRAVLRPAGGAPPCVVPTGARLRCPHCGGPVFAEEPDPIVMRPPAAVGPAPRGRPRKAPARAS